MARRLAATLCIAALTTGVAEAQDSITLSSDRAWNWDVAGYAGWAATHRRDLAPAWNRWSDSLLTGVSSGRYWTPHLKTELYLAYEGPSVIYQEQQLVVPGQAFPAYRLREHRTSSASMTPSLVYQFFTNQWFHPYASLGIEAGREMRRSRLPELRLPGRNGGALLIPAQEERRAVDWHVRPTAAVGFKWYFGERAFVRSELRVTASRRAVSRTTWISGMGVDL